MTGRAIRASVLALQRQSRSWPLSGTCPECHAIKRNPLKWWHAFVSFFSAMARHFLIHPKAIAERSSVPVGSHRFVKGGSDFVSSIPLPRTVGMLLCNWGDCDYWHPGRTDPLHTPFRHSISFSSFHPRPARILMALRPP